MLASPPPPVCHGFEFIEFAVDAETRPRLAQMFDAMGFAHVATHRSKDVTLHRQGDVNLILNAEKDAFAHSFFLLHGPSVCALAFRVDDARNAVERALRYKAQTFRGKVGPERAGDPGDPRARRQPDLSGGPRRPADASTTSISSPNRRPAARPAA